MSDPCLDLEQGINRLKDQEDEDDVIQFKKHPKATVMCVKVLLHMYPVVFLAATIVAVVSMYRTYNTWYSWLISLILSLGAIMLFWKFRTIKDENIQRMLGSNADSDLSTTLLAASTPKGGKE